MKSVTLQQYNNIDGCFCGKKPFRYYNISSNDRIAKCAFTKDEFDIKTREWVTSKKQPCGFNVVYHGERPVFKEIQQKIIKVAEKTPDPHLALQKKLEGLFRFLFVADRDVTLQEIDILVKYNLRREPRKIFYYPTVGLWMREACRESYHEYHDRIFSSKIIDLSIPKVIPKTVRKAIPKSVPEVSHFIDFSDEDDNDEIENDTDRDDGSDDHSSHYESDVDEEPDLAPEEEYSDTENELPDDEDPDIDEGDYGDYSFEDQDDGSDYEYD
jgi:hypothetical protein